MPSPKKPSKFEQRLRRSIPAVGAALAFLSTTHAAHAQVDVTPPLPNVLLLVDTSGSMEFKIDSSTVTCNPGNTLLTNERSRWINLVEVLTGSLNNYSCESLDRVSTSFRDGEYRLGGAGGVAPYDWRYPIPFHRPLSGGIAGCVAAPGTLPGPNPFDYPAGAIRYHRYNDTGVSCTPAQANDGILDAFGTRVRFGMMTFDTAVDASDGWAGGTPLTATSDLADGSEGLWSYMVGSAARGRRVACVTPSVDQEVGARNGAAPAWEGRMVNFGNPNDSERAYETKKNQIQEILLATRPFGATPIAGMLADAEKFFWDDQTKDPDAIPVTPAPTNPFDDYGPYNDPYLACPTARQQIVILLTDGEPNMDLRPWCATTPAGSEPAGECPFPLPETITDRLAHPVIASRRPIKTYVVGFAIEQVDDDNSAVTPTVACGSLVSTGGVLSPTKCADTFTANNVPLRACCTLHRIALAGDGEAFFANNAEELRSAISEILRRNVAATSRTQPTVAGGGALNGGSFRFFSGFEPGQLAPWNGQLRRQRWDCEAVGTGPKVPTPRTIDELKGDDFVANVNEDANHAQNRRFYTFVPKDSIGVVFPGRHSVRRITGTDPDGAGTLTAQIHTGNASAFATSVPSAAMDLQTPYPTGVATADAARTFYLRWLLGLANGASFTRCPLGGDCQLIGDIYHSTPQVVGAPSGLLRDESYARFSRDPKQKERPIVLYTSTNDGLLHAFKVASNVPADIANSDDIARVLTKTNNEIWAFAPPAVLPDLHALYPYNHQLLLDGVATITDVPVIQPSGGAVPVVFERTAADAAAGAGTWRTVLVQGFGPERSGYFAIDVTNPVPDPTAPTDVTKGGPRFLWQLTLDAEGKKLFGRGGATPTITTLFFDPSGGTNPREIPVAILPGGRAGARTAALATARTYGSSAIDSRFVPRPQVPVYDWGPGNADIGALSLTIVRLDTGEIIRSFRRLKTEVPSIKLRDRVTEVQMDSPITSQPVAFPGQLGAVADRIIVGDEDGRLWKVDVTSRNPASWTMKLFFDLYPQSIQSVVTHDSDDGQPISTPPVLSVDENGDMSVNVATGDQDSLGYSPTQISYVYSLLDKLNNPRTATTAMAKWYLQFTGGERVVGPLALFNTSLFFATFAPSSGSNVCDSGTSRVWGMHYLDTKVPGPLAPINQGGFAALRNASNALVQFRTASEIVGTANAVIFGVSLAQQPTCYDSDDDAVGDDLVGFQGLRRISRITPGQFELVMHTSAQASALPGSPVNTESLPLENPTSLSRIASWASVIE